MPVENDPMRSSSKKNIDGDFDIEEAKDTLGAGREKMFSDLTGMVDPEAFGTEGRRKTVSDVSGMVVMSHLPEEVKHRSRQKSSSDVITKMNQAGQMQAYDLKMAEKVVEMGTQRQRQNSHIPEKEFTDQIEENDAKDDFEFNHKGLTSEEAARLLEKYGRNELPESVDPKWLVFLRQFWAPMPIMIW